MRYLFILSLIIFGFAGVNSLHADDNDFFTDASNCDMVAQNPANSWFEKDSVLPDVLKGFMN